MKNKESLITREQLLFLFSYNRHNGTLWWRNPPKPNHIRLKGKRAGTIDELGYSRIKINRRIYLIHRLVWFIENNEWVEMIDHKNGDTTFNCIFNLRASTNRKNQSNRKQHREGKLVGANWHKQTQKWRSRIRINKKEFHLGMFNTELEAHQRYIQELRNL